MCHLSRVMCHMTCVTFSIFFPDKVVELVCKGSVINGAYLVQFTLILQNLCFLEPQNICSIDQTLASQILSQYNIQLKLILLFCSSLKVNLWQYMTQFGKWKQVLNSCVFYHFYNQNKKYIYSFCLETKQLKLYNLKS